MSQCNAVTHAGAQCSRVGKIELMVERADGTRGLIALCVHHHRLALKHRTEWLFHDGWLYYAPKPFKPGVPHIERDPEEEEEPDAGEE